jgi:hypothetical protein
VALVPLTQFREFPESGRQLFVVFLEFGIACFSGERRKRAGLGSIVVGGTQKGPARASVPRAIGKYDPL